MSKSIVIKKKGLSIGIFLMAMLILGSGLGTGIFSYVNAHGGDTELVHACVNNGSGTIKIVGANEECGNNEVSLDWNLEATDTDDQTLSFAGTSLTMEGGNSVDLSSLVNDADASPTNELNTAVTLDGTNLEIIDAGGTLSADLSSLQDGTGTDDQTLSFAGTSLTIEGGNSVDLSSLQDGVNDADADPTNELKQR